MRTNVLNVICSQGYFIWMMYCWCIGDDNFDRWNKHFYELCWSNENASSTPLESNFQWNLNFPVWLFSIWNLILSVDFNQTRCVEMGVNRYTNFSSMLHSFIRKIRESSFSFFIPIPLIFRGFYSHGNHQDVDSFRFFRHKKMYCESPRNRCIFDSTNRSSVYSLYESDKPKPKTKSIRSDRTRERMIGKNRNV